MIQIPDDPIIHAMEETGYPTWWDYEYAYEEEGEDDDLRNRQSDFGSSDD